MNRRNALLAMAALYVVIIFLFYSSIYLEHPLFLYLEQPLLILIPTVLLTAVYQKKGQPVERNWKEFYGVRKLNLPIILCLTLIAFLLPAIVNVIVDVTPDLEPDAAYVDDFLFKPEDHDSTLWRVGVFFYSASYAALFPGVCEEILFRGSLLRMSLDASLNKYVIIFSNALLFAIFHWNFEQLFYTFVIGIVLVSVVMVARSIWAGIYTHVLYDFIIDLSASFDLARHTILAKIAWVIENMNHWVFAVLAALAIWGIIKYMEYIGRIKTVKEEETA